MPATRRIQPHQSARDACRQRERGGHLADTPVQADALSKKPYSVIPPVSAGFRLRHLRHERGSSRSESTKPDSSRGQNEGAVKAVVLSYTVAGRERRITIGCSPHWSVSAARERACELKRRIDNGDDPLAERENVREAP